LGRRREMAGRIATGVGVARRRKRFSGSISSWGRRGCGLTGTRRRRRRRRSKLTRRRWSGLTRWWSGLTRRRWSGLTRRRRVVQRETLKRESIVELTLKVRGELTRVNRSKILRVRVGLEQRVFACYNLGPDVLQQIQVTA